MVGLPTGTPAVTVANWSLLKVNPQLRIAHASAPVLGMVTLFEVRLNVPLVTFQFGFVSGDSFARVKLSVNGEEQPLITGPFGPGNGRV